ncbi:hypothetical protein B4U78_003810 [Microbacterium esteraromaticum]|jgi:hypothetical protein|nr:hypothetical protein B4U78_003810 [Microbacterium esteraromaticum]
MIPARSAPVTALPQVGRMRCDRDMTHHDGNPDEHHHDAAADAAQAADGAHGNPEPAGEAAPDGQFDSQDMPTTDGEPAADDDSAAAAGAESQEEGDAAMRAAEEATKND